MANRCHVRSISLPSRSRPATLKLQQLYLRLLDISQQARDIIFQFKETVGDLQSALRRRKGDLCIESRINSYICSRKKMKKDAKRLLAAVKKLDCKSEASPLLDQDHQLSFLIRVISEVNAISMSVFRSLLMFLSTLVLRSKSSRWSLVSKFVHKGLVSCEEKQENLEDLENVDFAVTAISSKRSDMEKVQIARTGLGELEVHIEDLDKGLECMFRHLIKTRASLPNMISHYTHVNSFTASKFFRICKRISVFNPNSMYMSV